MYNKIKKLYLKYHLDNNNLKYIKKINNLLNNKNTNKTQNHVGGSNIENEIYALNLIIRNIELLTNDIKLYNQLLELVKEHDSKIQLFRKDFIIYDPKKQTLLEYIDIIYDKEKNLI